MYEADRIVQQLLMPSSSMPGAVVRVAAAPVCASPTPRRGVIRRPPPHQRGRRLKPSLLPSQLSEVLDHVPGLVAVRDPKVPDGGVLFASPAAWAAFVSALKG
jgi:PAS domain-containing protein